MSELSKFDYILKDSSKNNNDFISFLKKQKEIDEKSKCYHCGKRLLDRKTKISHNLSCKILIEYHKNIGIKIHNTTINDYYSDNKIFIDRRILENINFIYCIKNIYDFYRFVIYKKWFNVDNIEYEKYQNIESTKRNLSESIKIYNGTLWIYTSKVKEIIDICRGIYDLCNHILINISDRLNIENIKIVEKNYRQYISHSCVLYRTKCTICNDTRKPDDTSHGCIANSECILCQKYNFYKNNYNILISHIAIKTMYELDDIIAGKIKTHISKDIYRTIDNILIDLTKYKKNYELHIISKMYNIDTIDNPWTKEYADNLLRIMY